MKRRKIRLGNKRIYKTQKLGKIVYIILIVFSIILAGLVLGQILPTRPVRPLSTLPIPQIARVYLPEPLEFIEYNTRILGAQAFEPTDVVKYVNIERKKVNSLPLRLNPTLMKAAQMRADVIIKYQNFSHQDPYEDVTMVSSLSKLKFNYVYASENIGMGESSGESFVNGFMHSTAHRENLLNPKLTETGVALVTGQYKEYYVNIVVQLFAIPGGKDELLGYKSEDIANYKKLLDDLDSRLNPVAWNINKILGNRDYTDEKFNKLKRQHEILTKVYGLMKEEKPLQDEDVALIIEYNQNLN